MSRSKLRSDLPLGLEKDCPPHPGPLFRSQIREAWEPALSQEQIAGMLQLSPHELDEIERGARAITVDCAVRIAQLTGTDPEMWAALQMRHDLWPAIQADRLLRTRGVNAPAPIRRDTRLHYIDERTRQRGRHEMTR